MKAARSVRLIPNLLAAGALALAGVAQALPAAADDYCVQPQPTATGAVCIPLPGDYHSWHDAYDGWVNRVWSVIGPW